MIKIVSCFILMIFFKHWKAFKSLRAFTFEDIKLFIITKAVLYSFMIITIE